MLEEVVVKRGAVDRAAGAVERWWVVVLRGVFLVAFGWLAGMGYKAMPAEAYVVENLAADVAVLVMVVGAIAMIMGRRGEGVSGEWTMTRLVVLACEMGIAEIVMVVRSTWWR